MLIHLCDFGLCGICRHGEWRMSDFVGSPGFFAPEMLMSERYSARKVKTTTTTMRPSHPRPPTPTEASATVRDGDSHTLGGVVSFEPAREGGRARTRPQKMRAMAENNNNSITTTEPPIAHPDGCDPSPSLPFATPLETRTSHHTSPYVTTTTTTTAAVAAHRRSSPLVAARPRSSPLVAARRRSSPLVAARRRSAAAGLARSADPRKVDFWSLGAVMLEMLLGHRAFDALWMVSYSSRVMRDLGKVIHRRVAIAPRHATVMPQRVSFVHQAAQVHGVVQLRRVEFESRGGVRGHTCCCGHTTVVVGAHTPRRRAPSSRARSSSSPPPPSAFAAAAVENEEETTRPPASLRRPPP